MINEIHPSAVIGSGSTVWHFAVVLQDVVIGTYCSIGSGTEIGRGTTIGDRSRIGAQVFFPPNTRIGMNVFVGPGVKCTDDRHPVVSLAGPGYIAEPPTIGDFASIGANATILPGVRIGARARIGAGAIVSKDVPADGHVRGEPARARTLSERSAKAWR